MKNRVTMPVLLLLIAFVIGAGIVVYYTSERENARAEAVETSAPMGVEIDESAGEQGEGSEGGWQRHAWGAEPQRGETGERRRGEAGLIAPGRTDDEHYDPQMSAMRRSFRIEGDAGAGSLPFSPSEHEAQIVESEGLASSTEPCEVRVLPVRTSMFNCLVRVTCGGHVLYPNPEQTAGFAPCDIENGVAVRAHDDGHTAADGDPLVSVDLSSGIVTVEDRGDGVAPFRATLRLGRRVL